MKVEAISAEGLAFALARSARRAGWNFRDEPVSVATLGACAVYVVPVRTWVYCKRKRSSSRSSRGALGGGAS